MRFALLVGLVASLGAAQMALADGNNPLSMRNLNPLDLLNFTGISWSQASSDPELGGITFRDQAFDPSDRQYGSPYLETIYAHTLFDMLGNPKIRANGTAPSAPNDGSLTVDEVNDKLSQLFVLKTVANILDNEIQMKPKQLSLEVPYERIEYAVRKILVLDNAAMNDQIFETFIGNLVQKAVRAGPDAVAQLPGKGIPQVIIDLVQGKTPDGQNPQDIIAAFRSKFDADVERMIGAPSHTVPGLKTPSYSELTPPMLVRYNDLMHPTNDQAERFARLKAKVGTDPYFFGIAWNEGKDDDVLASMASGFAEQWQPVVIAGQNPSFGATDTFPADFDAFYRYVTHKLEPRQKASVRQKMANTIVFSFWRNRDILNPNPPRQMRHATDMFNPLSSIMINISSEDLAQAYDELKYELAAKDTPDYTLVEVKLGDSAAPATSNDTHPCIIAFNRAFEKPYTDAQKDVLKKLADPKLTTKLFDQLIGEARDRIPVDSFNAAKAEMNKVAGCENFAAVERQITIHIDPQAKNLSDDENARVRFVGMLVQNDQMQRMMIPKRSRRDDKGNVYHYFFQRHRIEYQSPDSEEVRAGLRDAVVMRRLADRFQEALANFVLSRYRVHANTDAFSYNDTAGFKLKSAVADPSKWLVPDEPHLIRAGDPPFVPGPAQLFAVPRMQKNPELVTERRLIERSTKLWEKAYDMP